MPAESPSGEGSPPGLQVAAFLLCPHLAFSLCAWEVGWGEELSGVSSYKDNIPFGSKPYSYSLI